MHIRWPALAQIATCAVLVTSVLACNKLRGGAPPGPKPTSDECDTLYDHEVDLIAGKDASAGVKSAAKATLIKSDVTTPWCETMSRAEYTCSMKATTKAAFDACDDLR